MTNVFQKFQRPLLLVAFPAAALFGIVYMAYAESSGITLQTNKPTTIPGTGKGCTCHGVAPSDTTTVTLAGPDKYEEGQSYDMIATVSNVSKFAAGIDIAAFTGTLGIASTNLQKKGTELTHRSPSPMLNGKTSWSFKYTVPTGVATDTIYAAGNAVNLSHDPKGDQWNFAPKLVISIVKNSIASPIESAGSLTLLANPTRGEAAIVVSQQKTLRGRLSIFDTRGALVRELPMQTFGEGNTEVRISLDGLASGEYFANLVSDDGAMSSVKFLKLR